LEFLNALNFGCESRTSAKIAVKPIYIYNPTIIFVLQYGCSCISGLYIFISVHCTDTSRIQIKSDSDKADNN